MSATVTRWSGYAQQAERLYGVPAAVLLALVDVESGGEPGQTSSAGAQGITQFVAGTARQYGVDTSPGHERSQVLGAAKYLHDLGYNRDPAHALASYNAGPANAAAGAGYARTVLERAKTYAHAGRVPPSSSSSAGRVVPAAAGAPAAGRGLLGALLTVGLVGAGGSLVWVALNQLTGGSLTRAAKTAGHAGAIAAVA